MPDNNPPLLSGIFVFNCLRLTASTSIRLRRTYWAPAAAGKLSTFALSPRALAWQHVWIHAMSYASPSIGCSRDALCARAPRPSEAPAQIQIRLHALEIGRAHV